MSYRIRYDEGTKWPQAGERSTWKFRLILSGCLLLTLLLMKWYLPEYRPVFASCFLPEDSGALQSMAQVLHDGGTARDGLLAFCRTLLRLNGYEN